MGLSQPLAVQFGRLLGILVRIRPVVSQLVAKLGGPIPGGLLRVAQERPMFEGCKLLVCPFGKQGRQQGLEGWIAWAISFPQCAQGRLPFLRGDRIL